MSIITSLIVQAVAGALGGNAVGGLVKNINLGPIGNSITGALGGGIGGHLLQALIPVLTGATATVSAGGFDIAAALGQAAGGGVTGAIVTVIVGLHQKRRDGTEVKLTKPSEAGFKGSNTSAATPVWNLGQSVRAALCNNEPACPDAI